MPAGEGEAKDEESNAPKYEWPGVRVLHLDRTARVKHLTALRGFCENRQHDHHRYDFAGRPRSEAARGQTYIVERMMRLAAEPDRKPAYEARKPDVPIPLQRQVVNGFDEMVYPRGLAPTIEVPADPRTERYLRAVMTRSLSWVTLQAARGDAGKTGEAAIRVGVDAGKPISEVLDTRELYVRLWANQMDHVPEVVVWQRLVEIEVETDKGLATECRWRTRIFDGEYEYVYEDVPENYGERVKPNMTRADGENEDTGWIPIARWTEEELEDLDDEAAPVTLVDNGDGERVTRPPKPGDPKIIEHQAGRCPIVWIQNTHTTQDPSGEPDCDGVHQLSDAIDLLASMNFRATRSNLDPTLHVKDQLRWHRMHRVYEKGWSAVIRTSESGDAKLLETAGQTVEMGWKTYNELRKEFLHTVRCVIIDPEHAGQYAQSGVAHAMLWRPMESAAGKKRVPQELAIQQVFELWMNLGDAWKVSSTEDEEPEGIVLPPVKLRKKVAEAQGYAVVMELEAKEDEEEPEVLAVHQVGSGKHVELIWPAYHETSPEQFQLAMQAITVGTGGAKVLSQRTGVRLGLQAAGMPDDVDGEIAQIDKESEKSMEKMAGMLGAGEPPDPNKPGEPEDEDGEDDGEDDDEAA